MIDTTLNIVRPLIPKKIFKFFQPAYHMSLAFMAAVIYRFPARKIKIIAVTGTKGKSSVTEILNAILEEAGYKTALSNTIRFKIDHQSTANLFKMSMPGRFFMQKMLRRAVNKSCKYAIIEMTSQGALLYRHLFVDPDTLVFTNLSPEHIEAHGSYENYVLSKLSLAKAVANSKKSKRTLIVNTDDKEANRFLSFSVDRKIPYSLQALEPYSIKEKGLDFTWNGKKVSSPLSGKFNLYNLLGAMTAAHSEDISDEIIVRAIERFGDIPGRVQKIDCGQNFEVIVDYAHTADSLEKFYEVFKSARNICVLGGTGGGRDTWKRSEMGKIADEHCDNIILTNEDPYDEDPLNIINNVADGIKKHRPQIIMDRREAIRKAIKLAGPGDAVLITGKGTDPYIMGPNGSKQPWSDAEVAREEIKKRLENNVEPGLMTSK